MDHDRLFKELLRTFFLEFIDAFLPKVQEFIDPSSIEFLDKEVFTDVASMARLLRHPNPVVAALMTKMQIEPKDRPRVALECLRMIATLKLDSARQTFIHAFMNSYLRLSAEE